jgi:uncharacterized membrane protein (DUF2068 family)
MGPHAQGSDGVAFGIGVFKLVKATVLIAIGVASLMGVAESWIEEAAQRIAWSGAFPGRATLRLAVADLMSVDEETIRRVGIAALCYAAVFATEGAGLVLRKRWAEWLVVGVTASFIPLEVYELWHRFGVGKLVALALNVAIGGYLLWERVREAPRSHARTQTSRA